MEGRPLLVASAALCAGAFLGTLASVGVAFLGAALALAAAFPARTRAVALGLALGLLRGALHERPTPARLSTENEEIAARIVSLEAGRATVRLHQGALALVHLREAPDVHRGDEVLLWGRLRTPPPALNPGGADRRAALAVRGIALEGSAEVLEVRSRGPRFWAFLDAFRSRFGRRAREMCRDADRAALVAALAVGDRSGISPALDDELSASGLVHLLASSGLHLAVVGFLGREAARRAWLRTPWAHRSRAAAVGAAAAFPLVVAEVLLLGAPWPAVRAGIAAGLALLASALDRRRDSLATLFAGAAGCALADPAATHDLALQLSVAGIFGLVVLARPLREMLPSRRVGLAGRALEHLVQLGCATAAATLCTAPLLAASFHRVSLVSVAANTLALTPGLAAIPVATALIAIDVRPLWWIADGLAGVTLFAARAFAALPFATAHVAAPGLALSAVWYAGVLLLATRAPPARRLVRAALPFALLAAIVAARAALARHSTAMRVIFLAVGQGDCAVVQLPGGKTLLVDAGGDLRGLPDAERPDPGARHVVPALAELGVSRIDLAVLTHAHPDHAGGLLSVLERIPVAELWMNPGEDPISRAVRERARARRVPIQEPEPRTVEGVRIEVPSHHDPRRSLNDDSIVLRLVHRDVAVLLAGDVEALAEADLAQGAAPIEAALLKAPHHGSRTSSTDAFLRRVAPRFVVYSVGAQNPFGFPHPDVVARSRALGAEVFRTDEGAVIAVSDGRTLLVAGWRRR